LRDIARQDLVQLNKPVKLNELAQAIQWLLTVSPSAMQPDTPPPADVAGSPQPSVIFVVDDNGHVREGMREMLEEDGRTVEDYATCEAFLDAYRPGRGACLLIDAYLPGMNGIELLQRLRAAGDRLPMELISTSPSSRWIDAAGHHRVTRARREESSRGVVRIPLDVAHYSPCAPRRAFTIPICGRSLAKF
jgi:CheY-like chemotaxis protein